MLHQGLAVIPVEFVLIEDDREGPRDRRAPLLANALAQAQALLRGKTEAEAAAELGADKSLAPHKTFPGDRPSTIIALDQLTPEALGALIAFYEHRTFTQGIMLGINSFDQWGVELGKQMAGSLTDALRGAGAPANADPSTLAWIERLKRPS